MVRITWENEKVLNPDELAELVLSKYAQKGRFKGQYMSISVAGQNVLIKIISTRLNGISIAIVAKILSSNVCENYFSVLTKFSHGKRKNGDFTDTWRIQQCVVAGLISNENLCRNCWKKWEHSQIIFVIKNYSQSTEKKYIRKSFISQLNTRIEED